MPIFDQGYQHWRGPLSGHAWRWLVIARQGVRVQLRGLIFRLMMLAVWLPAGGLVAAVVLWGMIEQKNETVLRLLGGVLPPEILEEPRLFRSTAWTLAFTYFFKFQTIGIMLLLVVAGPGLISRDLRFNALPLYLARPVSRFDYFLGKLGVIAALVGMAAIGPAVLAYVIGVCCSLDLSVVKDTYPVLLASIAYGLLLTLSMGTFMLALSSLTQRSLYVGIAWAGMWIISGAVGSILTTIHHEGVSHGLYEEFMTHWLAENPPPPGVRLYPYGPQVEWRAHADGKYGQRLAGISPDHEEEGERWFAAYMAAAQEGSTAAQQGLAALQRDDWRPLLSYVTNLDRLADGLLGTDAAWVAMGKAFEPSQRARAKMAAMLSGPSRTPPVNERVFADQKVWQYPWEWSAGVLAALLGLSLWTLSRRVKSLDRLK